MTWVRIDDGLAGNPKVVGLSDAAFRSYIEGLCYCGRYLTDGTIAAKVVSTIAKPKTRRELVDAGLWHEVDGGVEVHDFLDYNRSKIDVEAQRAKTAARVKEWRRGRNADSNASSNGVTNAAPDPTRPEGLTAEVLDVGKESAFRKPERSKATSTNTLQRLLDALPDADDKTKERIETMHRTHRFSEGDFVEAGEAANSGTARSPSGVAISVLQKRARNRGGA